MNNNITINQTLIGENSFYNQSDYEAVTREQLDSSQPIKTPIYTYNTEHKVWRVVKDILSVIIFPIGLYRLVHRGAGKFIVPASAPGIMGIPQNYADQMRKQIELDVNWKVKRISVEVDGHLIDAAIIGQASTLGNGRWVLASNGNGEFYEDKLQSVGRLEVGSFKHILTGLKGNAIVFNYAGVGASTGMPNRNAMAKAYRAMLSFLEDKENGIGATEIIGYGHSIGGGVQGDALFSHELKQDVKYVFVKSRTFSDLSTEVSHLIARPLGFLIKLFGWNISSVESSKRLRVPEIIMQTVNAAGVVIHDDAIPAEASLATKLQVQNQTFRGDKYFMGIQDRHNENLRDLSQTALIEKINEMLS